MSELIKQNVPATVRSEIVIDSLSPAQITKQLALVEQVMKENMKEGVDYGTIPGCGPKPSLFKAGAEKLRLLFFLSPEFNWAERDLGSGHTEWEFSCTLTQIHTGKVWGQGVGSASTMESKYRYRYDKGRRVENNDIADQYNTVRKMAKKRSFVDAILTATSASGIFTQDLEDMQRRDRKTQKEQNNGGNGNLATTTLIVPPDEEGRQVWRAGIKRVVVKSGVKKDGQPWMRTSLLLPGDTQDYWVSTFDKTLSKKVATFDGKVADITVKPAQAEGQWDLIDIAEPKADVQPVLLPEDEEQEQDYEQI